MKVLQARYVDIVIKASDKAIGQYCEHCEREITSRGLRVIDPVGSETFFCNDDCYQDFNEQRYDEFLADFYG